MSEECYPPATIMGLAKELNKVVNSTKLTAEDTLSSLEKVIPDVLYPNEKEDNKHKIYTTENLTIKEILLNTLYSLNELKGLMESILDNVTFKILDGSIESAKSQTSNLIKRNPPKISNLKHKGTKLPTRGVPINSDDDDYDD